MTIQELKTKLSRYPDDYKVILDVSRDYEEYDEAKHVILCNYGFGICGTTVERVKKIDAANAVLLT